MFRFPFTNFHELNLDWILSVVKEAKAVFDNGRTDIDYAVSTADEAKEIATQAAEATIADNSISTSKLQNGAVTHAKLSNNSVTTDNIVDRTIIGNDIAENTIESYNIKNGTIIGADIADDTITSDKLNAGAVTNTKIADNAVTNAKIANGTIERDKLVYPYEVLFQDIETTADGGVNVSSTTNYVVTYNNFLNAIVIGENNETVVVYTYSNSVYCRVLDVDTWQRNQAVHTIRIFYRRS